MKKKVISLLMAGAMVVGMAMPVAAEEKTWTIAKVKDFCDKYSKKYPENKLTYSPIIIIAKKK